MSSIISGPILSSFDSNSNFFKFPESDNSFSNYAYQMNDNRLGNSLYNLNLLQWQDQPSSLSSSTNLSSNRSQKNHIRENIRNLRRLEQQRKEQQQQQFQQSFSTLLTDRSFRSNQTSMGANRQLPPKPLTLASNQLVHSKSLPNRKVQSTAVSTTMATGTGYGDNSMGKFKTMDSVQSMNSEKYVQTWNNKHVGQGDTPLHRLGSLDQAIQTQTLTDKPPTPNRSRSNKNVSKDARINVSKAIQTNEVEQHSTPSNPQDFRLTNKLTKQDQSVTKKSNQTSQFTTTKPLISKVDQSPDRLTKHHYLRAHARDAVADSDLKLLSTVPIQPLVYHPDPNKMTVPRAKSAKNVQLIRRNINFIRTNAHLASTSPVRPNSSMRRASSMGNLTTSGTSAEPANQSECPPDLKSKPNRSLGGMWPQRKLPCGAVPQYLIKRQQKIKQVQAQSELNKPDPDQPPGHQRMPEQERLDTLELLKKAHAELLSELVHLPIRSDTLRVRSRRAEIETRLTELEQAIGIFSKPKVYIKPD